VNALRRRQPDMIGMKRLTIVTGVVTWILLSGV